MHALDNCGGGELKEVHCRPEPERHDSWGTLERKADRLPGVNDVGARLSNCRRAPEGLHFFVTSSSAAASARAFSFLHSSFWSRLISRWSWARSFSSCLCSLSVSAGFSLASCDVYPQRSTCSWYRPRSRQ